MSQLANALLIAAVVVLVLVRQFRPQRVANGARWWLLPAVLMVLVLRDPGPLVDPRHQAASVLLLAGELILGVGMGAAWAFTTRIWRDGGGAVWMRGTKATAAIWAGGIAVRLALAGTSAALGLHQGSAALMLSLPLMLLIRTGLLMWRSQGIEPLRAVFAVR